MTPRAQLAERGWVTFPATKASLRWARAANDAATAVLADPEMRRTWLQCEGTWFVGVDALPTDRVGAINGVPLASPALDAVSPVPPLHPAQLSVIFPGYPKPRAGESDAAFRFRDARHAAHVDGLLAEGPDRRRFIREPHAFILGIALNDAPPEASPLVVWPGSHTVMRAAFRAALKDVPQRNWSETDVTQAYTQARKQVFDISEPVAVPLRPGEAVLVHRLAVHGIAQWRAQGESFPQGRRIAYFRPQLEGGVADWLSTDSWKQSVSRS